MNNKIDVHKTDEMILHIQRADWALNEVIHVLKQQALPLAHKLSQEHLDKHQKLSKSLSAIIATCINQHLRLVKLISMLEKRTKKEKILKTLDKTNCKGIKLMTELTAVQYKLGDYIRITKQYQSLELEKIRKRCEFCGDMLSKPVADFGANTQHLKSLLSIEEK